MTKVLSVTYIAMAVLANWTVALFGPSAAILNAGIFIGPCMTVRDGLHERWQDNLRQRMIALILVASLISLLLSPNSGMIALGSFVAFVSSEMLDAFIYSRLAGLSVVARRNVSNIPSAVVDTIVFQAIAFGGLVPQLVIGQIIAKIVGGFVWSLIIPRRVK